MAGVMSYYTGGVLQIRDSKKRRDKILAMLTENDTTAQIGINLDDAPAAPSAAPTAAPVSSPSAFPASAAPPRGQSACNFARRR